MDTVSNPFGRVDPGQEVRGPAGGAVRAVVGARLHQEDVRAGLGEARGDDGAGRAAADHGHVRADLRAHGARSSQSVVP